MATIYTIETPNKWGFIKAINSKRFNWCKMVATSCVGNFVQVKELEGSCVDALDEIIDKFSGSQYVIGAEAKKVIGGF